MQGIVVCPWHSWHSWGEWTAPETSMKSCLPRRSCQEVVQTCTWVLTSLTFSEWIQGTQGVSAARSSGNRVCNRSKAVGMERHAHAAQKCCSRLYRTAGVSTMMAVAYNNTVCWLRDNHLCYIRSLMTRFEIQMKMLMCLCSRGSSVQPGLEVTLVSPVRHEGNACDGEQTLWC